jgi:hypothetical protein
MFPYLAFKDSNNNKPLMNACLILLLKFDYCPITIRCPMTDVFGADFGTIQVIQLFLNFGRRLFIRAEWFLSWSQISKMAGSRSNEICSNRNYPKFQVIHTRKISGSRLWEVKNSGCENSSPTEVKRTFIHQNLSIFITKSMRNFLSNQKLSTKPAHLHLSFGTSISNLCSVHFPFVAIIFTSLAYEIFYARKVDLFDKIREVIFSQLFPRVFGQRLTQPLRP